MRIILLIVFASTSRLVSTSSCSSWLSEYITCLPDLSGYRVCNRPGSDGPVDVKCPGNTRCACFVNNECDMVPNVGWGIAEKDICQVFPEPHPMKRVLHLTYKKGGYEWRYDDDYQYYDQEGEIKQDLHKQKILHTWGIPEHRRFKIIIPDGTGAFIRFFGKLNPNRCRKTRISKFPEFAGEMKYWRLKWARKMDANKNKNKNNETMERQMWYNEIFRYQDDGLTKRWTVVSDPVNKQVVPVRYHSTYTGTQEEQCCDFDVHIDYKEVDVDPNINTDEWFQVPDFCP